MSTSYFETRNSCPVCGETTLDDFYSCGFTADPVHSFIESHYRAQGLVDWSVLNSSTFVVSQCRTCNLIFQRHVPTTAMLHKIYTEMISAPFLQSLEKERLTLGNFESIAGELSTLFRLVGKHPSKITLLDFGFGHGRWARVARAMGAEVFVTDFGDDRLEVGADIGVHVIEDEEIEKMHFDIVHTEQVFEHLVHPADEFRRLARATTGIFKVAVPRHANVRRLLEHTGLASESPFDRRLRNLPPRFDDDDYVAILPLEHLNVYSEASMYRLAADNGMEVVGKVRIGTVPIDPVGVSAFVRSAIRTIRMITKIVVRPNSGYYLFRPSTSP